MLHNLIFSKQNWIYRE